MPFAEALRPSEIAILQVGLHPCRRRARAHAFARRHSDGPCRSRALWGPRSAVCRWMPSLFGGYAALDVLDDSGDAHGPSGGTAGWGRRWPGAVPAPVPAVVEQRPQFEGKSVVGELVKGLGGQVVELLLS